MKIQFLALFASVALSGCSSEPSNGDIESALNKHFEQSQAASKAMVTAMVGKQAAEGAPKMAWKINSLKKVNCQEQSGAYLCNVDTDLEAPMVGRVKQILPLRLIKASEGWQLTAGFGG